MSYFLQDRRTSIDRIDSACLFVLSERARLIFKIWLLKKIEDVSLELSEERLGDLEKIMRLVGDNNLRPLFFEKLFDLIYQRSQALFVEFKKTGVANEELISGESLGSLRRQLYHLDVAYVNLLIERFALVRSVGIFKKENNIAPLDASRWENVLKERIYLAGQLKIPKSFVKNVMELIHEEALYLESI